MNLFGALALRAQMSAVSAALKAHIGDHEAVVLKKLDVLHSKLVGS
jgi:hypothetical protein